MQVQILIWISLDMSLFTIAMLCQDFACLIDELL